jgi:hypothetical protein
MCGASLWHRCISSADDEAARGKTRRQYIVSGGIEKGAGRSFKPMVDERWEELMAGFIDAELVGEMVRDAIQRSQLYLHTHSISHKNMNERMNLIFGPDSFGRANQNLR